MSLVEIFFHARTWLSNNLIELVATFAGGDGETTVAGWFVVFDFFGVGLTDEAMIWWSEALDKGAGAVFLALVVEITDVVSMMDFQMKERKYLPFVILTSASAIVGNVMKMRNYSTVETFRIYLLAMVLRHMTK